MFACEMGDSADPYGSGAMLRHTGGSRYPVFSLMLEDVRLRDGRLG